MLNLNGTLNVAVIVKLEPDFSEGNVSYNADGTLNRAETKNILGPHSAVASSAALYSKVKHNAHISVATMGPPNADLALQQSQLICNADELHLYSDRIFAGADTLATAEVLKAGINKMANGNNMDIVFSGHRASDGETGQTGPQTAWKLAYPFLGNVIDYDIDINRHCIKVQRIIKNYGDNDIMEEIEAPLPVFISLDPSYNPFFNTVSQRLKLAHHQKEAQIRSYNYKEYLKIFSAQSLEVSPKSVGLPGSPTIVYKVEKIPRAKATRKAEIIDGNDQEKIDQVVIKIYDILKLGEREGGSVVR
jgi:electron transfer flavoprotein beta subunit